MKIKNVKLGSMVSSIGFEYKGIKTFKLMTHYDEKFLVGFAPDKVYFEPAYQKKIQGMDWVVESRQSELKFDKKISTSRRSRATNGNYVIGSMYVASRKTKSNVLCIAYDKSGLIPISSYENDDKETSLFIDENSFTGISPINLVELK